MGVEAAADDDQHQRRVLWDGDWGWGLQATHDDQRQRRVRWEGDWGWRRCLMTSSRVESCWERSGGGSWRQRGRRVMGLRTEKPSTACKNGLLWKCLADSCRFRLVLCDNLSMNVVGDELILQLAFVHCFSYVLHFARQNSTPSPLLKAVSLATNLFFISFVNRGLSG